MNNKMTEEEYLKTNPWVFVRHSLLLKDGNWNHWKKGDPFEECEYWKEPWLSKRFEETHPYFYFDQHRGDQSCLATIHVVEREWVHHETANRMVHKDIEVAFSSEIGSESGSWKGGVIGCGCEMLPNETPLDTLRRMERERSFR